MTDKPVIVVAPDKTCLDEEGLIKSGTEVILISDPGMYEKMQVILEAWGIEEIEVEGKRGEIEG